VTEAIIGLVGVVIGGVLTGVVQAVQQRRAERAEARAAARLLSAELSKQELYLHAGGDAKPSPARAWPQYRAVMARALDDQAWQTVAGAYVELELWHEGAVPEDLPTLLEQVGDAHAALQKLWLRSDDRGAAAQGPAGDGDSAGGGQ
jgi:type II secretory pathway pseudopilin PulG